MTSLLSVRDLTVGFGGSPKLHGFDLEVERGETVAIVGESGSGKTLAALAIIGLLPPGATMTAGRIRFCDQVLTEISARDRRLLRGRSISMVFQDPGTSLNPVLTIRDQLDETIRRAGERGPAIRVRRRNLLESVELEPVDRILASYPHELSGGMRQRVMIAMALAGRPQLLIADEPTTALDVTVQQGVLDLLGDLQRRRDLAVLLISHDLAMVAQRADRAVVLLDGRVVERAPIGTLFGSSRHPYTRGLIEAIPVLGERRSRLRTVAAHLVDAEGAHWRPGANGYALVEVTADHWVAMGARG